MKQSNHSNPKDSSCSQMASHGPSQIVTLEIMNLGPVASFKNAKRICGNRLITRPDVKSWMTKATQSFVSQLVSLCRTKEGGTTTECCQRFLTVSLPLDDCWTEVEIGTVKTFLCLPGQEGAIITIQRL
jgi:hypothetical protein